ncbi:hypothetical protein V6Z11_A06G029400 [Gossypium hirsutum]
MLRLRGSGSKGQRGKSLPFWCNRCQGGRPLSGARPKDAHGGCSA